MEKGMKVQKPALARRVLSWFVMWFFIGCRVVCSVYQIINAGAIKICQGAENGNGDVQISQLIVRVSGLVNIQHAGNVSLL